MQPLEPERLSHRAQLLEEGVHRPERRVVRLVRVAPAELVVEDDAPPLLRQGAQALERVVRAPGPAVQREQRQATGRFHVADDAVPGLELTERKTAFHARILAITIRGVVDSWRRYKRDLSESEDRPVSRWTVLRPKQVSQRDLLIPTSADRLKLLGACLACGFGLSVLWIYFPMLMVSIALDRDFGFWKWAVMGGFGAVAGSRSSAMRSADEQRYWDSLG